MQLFPLLWLTFSVAALATPLPDYGVPKDKVVYPAIDANINRQDLSNLEPTFKAVFQYREPHPGDSGVSLDFKMNLPLVTLENSAFVEDVRCSPDGDTVTLDYATPEALAVARQWPKSLVLITNSRGCNPENERGVYLVAGSAVTTTDTSISFNTSSVSWKDVAETMKISYGKVTDAKPEPVLVKQEKRATPSTPAVPSLPSCTLLAPLPKNYACGIPGRVTAIGPAYVPTFVKTFQYCRDACSAWSVCQTFSFASDSKKCTLMSKSILQQGFILDLKSKTTFYNRNCFKCAQKAGFPVTGTRPVFPPGSLPGSTAPAVLSSTTRLSSSTTSRTSTTTRSSSTSTSTSRTSSSTSSARSSSSTSRTSSTSSSTSRTSSSTSTSTGTSSTRTSSSTSSTSSSSSTRSSSISTSSTSSSSTSTSSTPSTSSTSSTSSTTTTSTPSSTTTTSSTSTSTTTTTPSTSSSTTTSTASSTTSADGEENPFAAPPTSLSPEQVATYSSIVAAITFAPDGVIVGDLGPSATVASAIPAPTFDPNDAAAIAAIENELLADGIAPASTVVDNTANALGGYDPSGDLTGITEIAPDGTTSTNGDTKRSLRLTTTDFASKIAYARSNGTERKFRLTKRYGIGDFLDDFDTYACNDLATSLSDTLEGVCAGVDGGKAVYCLATGCYNQASGPPATQYTFDYSWSVNFPTLSGRNMYADRNGQVLCQNCGLSVSSIAFKGTVVVVLSTTQLQSAVVTATESAQMNLVMNLITNGPASGSWSGDISTSTLATISTPGVFSIAPKIIYGLGVSYQTDGAVNVIGGASMTLSNAATDLDLIAGTASNSVNWQPSGQIQYPTLSTTARVVLTPFMRTSIQMSVQVFGRQIQNLAALTTQTNLGFDGSLLLQDTPTKRQEMSESTDIEKRGFFSGSLFNIIEKARAAAAAAAAAAGYNLPAVNCPAGQVILRASMRTTNAVSFGGAQNVLYDNNYPFKAKCFNVPIPPPSQAEVSSLASNGGAFCTSFIKYIPWASTTNLKTTISTVSTSFKAAAAITVFPKTSTFLTTKFVAPTGYTGPPVKRSAQPAATLLRRQAVPTPTQITAWPPQKISAACSQIATGYTVVTAYTSTLTSYTSTTVKTVRATVTAPTPVTTQIVTSTGCASQPTGAVVNPYFAPVQVYSPQVPSPWSISGVTSYSNCQYNFNDAFCSYINFQRYGYNTMMSMLLSGTYDSGRISQPLTNLVAGRAYNLTVVTAYSSPSQINCIVTYELDGVPFKSFLPTFPSSNSPSATYELATFYPTAASHALAVNIYCPTYNKGEGNRALIAIAGIDAQGPICPYFISKPAAPGCPAGVTQGPTAVDGSGAIFDIKCGTNYGGTIMASTSDMDLLGSDADNDCLAWCNTWGGACAAVAYDTRSSNCILYSDNTAATSKDASFVYAARVQ